MLITVTAVIFDLSYHTGFAQMNNESNNINSSGFTVTDIPIVKPMGEEAHGSSVESPGVLSGN